VLEKRGITADTALRLSRFWKGFDNKIADPVMVLCHKADTGFCLFGHLILL